MDKLSKGDCNFSRLKPGTILFDSVSGEDVMFERFIKKKDSMSIFDSATIQVKKLNQKTLIYESLIFGADSWRFKRK